MIDVKFLQEDKEIYLKMLEARGFSDFSFLDEIINLNEQRKLILQEMESARAEQNIKSKNMPTVMKTGTEDEKKNLQDALKILSEKVKNYLPNLKNVEENLNNKLLYLPNVLHVSTPIGKSEEENVVVKMWGEKPLLNFMPREHFDIAHNALDFERGVKLSKSRFVVYFGLIAKLERALINFMLDTHATKGYTEVLPPYIVSRESMTATGQLPKFEEEAFKTTDDMFLIPTSEVSLMSLHRDEILSEEQLPLKYTAYSPCFRREAGSYGKDVKGLIRVHQFNKVELVKYTKPEDSDKELDALLADAEDILQKLNLHYRVIQLCSGDIGNGSAKTYDIEVWLPGQNKYREISSCSNIMDYQARRGLIRFKRKEAKKTEFVHSLNGSGLALGRTVVAILEQYQQADGSVVVPDVLLSYLNGVKILTF